MIPGLEIKTKDLRTVVAFGDCEDGLYWVEPMRFLFPSEARNEAKAKSPERCAHRKAKA